MLVLGSYSLYYVTTIDSTAVVGNTQVLTRVSLRSIKLRDLLEENKNTQRHESSNTINLKNLRSISREIYPDIDRESDL